MEAKRKGSQAGTAADRVSAGRGNGEPLELAVTPNPGSREAQDLGCSCPVLDNARGRGAWGSEGKDAIFFITDGCKVHGTARA